jgi:hypothetical protein
MISKPTIKAPGSTSPIAKKPKVTSDSGIHFALYCFLVPGVLQLARSEEWSGSLRSELSGHQAGLECAQEYEPHKRSDPRSAQRHSRR